MSDPSLVVVNTAIDTFQNWIDKFNNVVSDMTTTVVTANATAGVTTGNAYVQGNLSALQLLTPSLAGGNLSGTANLTVSTNVSVGNSTVNTWVGFAQINIGTSSVNASTIAAGANVTLNVTSLGIGNSTVNTFANSSQVNTGTAKLSSQALVGANVTLSTTSLSIGNSTVNLFANSLLLELANSTVVTNVQPSGLTVAQTIVNSGGFYGGATDILSIGNSTVNLVINSSTVYFNGARFTSGGNVIVAVSGTTVGNAVALNFNPQGSISVVGSVDAGDGFVNVNISASGSLGGAGGANTDVLFNDSGTAGGSDGFKFNKTTNVITVANTLAVGANVVLNTSSLGIGNSTVNVFANSLLVQAANSTGSANLVPLGLVVGTSLVNATVLAAGANVVANTSSVVVGNSTVLFFANAILAQMANSTATANLAVGGLTVATQVVNTSVIASGANVILSTSALNIGNSTVNTFANSSQINTGTAVVSSAVDVGANVVLNTTTLVIGNTTANVLVNAIIMTLANSTATSNIVPGLVSVGTSVVNTTAIALGANVFLNQLLLFLGNSTVNGAANSTELLYQNSTITANVSLAGFYIGNSTANCSINSSGVAIGGVIASGSGDAVHTLYGGL